MTTNTPPVNPEAQAQNPSASGNDGPRQRPWLEPAVVVGAIGLAVTVLALLLSIVFGIYGMNARMDDLGARIDTLGTRMDALEARMDALGSDLNARMGALSADINARMDALSADINARMDALSTSLNARMDSLGSRMDKVYQLLLPQQSRLPAPDNPS